MGVCSSCMHIYYVNVLVASKAALKSLLYVNVSFPRREIKTFAIVIMIVSGVCGDIFSKLGQRPKTGTPRAFPAKTGYNQRPIRNRPPRGALIGQNRIGPVFGRPSSVFGRILATLAIYVPLRRATHPDCSPPTHLIGNPDHDKISTYSTYGYCYCGDGRCIYSCECI